MRLDFGVAASTQPLFVRKEIGMGTTATTQKHKVVLQEEPTTCKPTAT